MCICVCVGDKPIIGRTTYVGHVFGDALDKHCCEQSTKSGANEPTHHQIVRIVFAIEFAHGWIENRPSQSHATAHEHKWSCSRLRGKGLISVSNNSQSVSCWPYPRSLTETAGDNATWGAARTAWPPPRWSVVVAFCNFELINDTVKYFILLQFARSNRSIRNRFNCLFSITITSTFCRLFWLRFLSNFALSIFSFRTRHCLLCSYPSFSRTESLHLIGSPISLPIRVAPRYTDRRHVLGLTGRVLECGRARAGQLLFAWPTGCLCSW